MNISCNGDQHVVDQNVTLYSLLLVKELAAKKGIAAAVNNTVIPKNQWDECVLQENDKVLIITAVQGG